MLEGAPLASAVLSRSPHSRAGANISIILTGEVTKSVVAGTFKYLVYENYVPVSSMGRFPHSLAVIDSASLRARLLLGRDSTF